jgi:hypothetical protein
MGGLEVIFLLFVAPCASLFAFDLIGWLFGAGNVSSAHSKLIAVVALLATVIGVGFGGAELLGVGLSAPNYPTGGALCFLFIIVPSCIGFLIGGLNGMTR